MSLNDRIVRLEAQAQTGDRAGSGFTLAQWRAQNAQERAENLTPEQWLERRLSELDRWPAERRADMERVWRQLADTERMMLQGDL